MDSALEIALRLGCAALAGVALGLNRWLHHKSAGVKTHALVAIGSALAVLCMLPEAGVPADSAISLEAASRVFQGLLAGVGFLGAGVIIHNVGTGRVQGLTTAASIWATTILGAAFGMGFFKLATIGLLTAALVLLVGTGMEQALGRLVGHRDKDGG